MKQMSVTVKASFFQVLLIFFKTNFEFVSETVNCLHAVIGELVDALSDFALTKETTPLIVTRL